MTQADTDPFVVAIDGPSGSGKGSLASELSRALGFHLLDSGAIYRLVAIKTLHAGLDLDDERQIANIIEALDIRFESGEKLVTPFLDGQDVSSELRLERTGDAASRVAKHPRVRKGLLEFQRSFFTAPGLVADGRDMGTVVFPDARHKFYLYANAEIRAQRRYKQLINMGLSANIADLREDIAERDERDANRASSPMQPAEDALFIDSSVLDLTQVFNLIIEHVREGGNV